LLLLLLKTAEFYPVASTLNYWFTRGNNTSERSVHAYKYKTTGYFESADMWHAWQTRN